MSGCAIPGCTDPCRSRQLMCKWHWKKVPAALKSAVLSTWKPVSVPMRNTPRGPEERLAEIGAYRAAVAAAVANVCEQEGLRHVD